MGVFDGMMVSLYRYTTDGRRIYRLRYPAPPRWWPSYLVSDSDAALLEGRLRRTFTVFYGAMPPIVAGFAIAGSIGTFHPSLWLIAVLVIVLPALVMYSALRFFVLRGIPRVTIDSAELVPLPFRAQEMTQLKAMGVRTQILLIVTGLLLTAVQVVVLVQDRPWWSWIGTALFAGSTLYFVRGLFLLRRASRGAAP